MATMTYTETAALAKSSGQSAKALDAAVAAGEKRGFFARLVAALQESRMRQAEIEVRRVRALLADNDTGFKDALLPFKGE
jgi:hypothetical protein